MGLSVHRHPYTTRSVLYTHMYPVHVQVPVLEHVARTCVNMCSRSGSLGVSGPTSVQTGTCVYEPTYLCTYVSFYLRPGVCV